MEQLWTTLGLKNSLTSNSLLQAVWHLSFLIVQIKAFSHWLFVDQFNVNIENNLPTQQKGKKIIYQ